jgi:hypothetical protein
LRSDDFELSKQPLKMLNAKTGIINCFILR